MKQSAFSLLLLFASPALFAHDTWILPEKFSVEPPAKITFTITSGMEFPKLDSGPKPERVARSGLQVGAEKKELTNLRPSKEALKAEAEIAQPGPVVAWAQFKPREIRLTDQQVSEYFAEVRAPDGVRKKWAEQKGVKPWVEYYTKCAKTLFSSGSPTSGEAHEKPVGLALEIVPLTSPAFFQTGTEATFRLLREGEPLAGASIALHQAGRARVTHETTDTDGRVTFRFAEPGPAMLATVHLLPPAPEQTWKSEFSTLTFEVGEKSSSAEKRQ